MFLAVCISSCRTEEEELIQTPEELLLTANSTVANLMLKTVSNDGSNDNILDRSNCFNLKLPLKVTANNQEITINAVEDYKIVEYIFDDEDDDIDNLDISFPITLVFADYSETMINSMSQLSSYSNNCNGENEVDNDIECLDFNYPISASIFNTTNDLISTQSVTDDSEFFEFIKNIDPNQIVSIQFPITVVLFDQTELTIHNLKELESAIEDHKNDCDEDDDFDYNDDDCDDCATDQLTAYLVNCSNWTVDKLERYGQDYDDAYYGYIFNFSNNGDISVYWSGITAYGTWAATGSGNNITVTIDIPGLPYCNNDWVLHEISEYTETKIDLRVGDNDRIRYENYCN
ncbi:hypothetical protein [Aestuariivivens sediminis]|uniref:hypothetical protein n=1 Tax=Aestuariivivens sediminis TaxID=2913557 RepID=UPI001F5A0660|nr:hypothetical protein [Aestuariivivens sediminis]